MRPSVVLLTSTNLSCNPRCLKEVRLLSSMNVDITVVAFNLHNWTTAKEKMLNDELKNVEFYYLEATKFHLFPWLTATVIEKISRLVVYLFPSNLFFLSMVLGKRGWLLLQWLKKWEGKADLIIAHNPPAFYPAYQLSKKMNKPFAIDIEDYHPGEENSSIEKRSVVKVMQELFSKAAYSSFASPLIKIYSEKLIKNKPDNFILINNTFSEKEFVEPVNALLLPEKLQLVWFSQFIDYGRGLEKVLHVLDQFSEKIELTLIGNLRDSFYITELKDRNYIHCLSSLSQVELNTVLSRFDIGLALEDKNVDLNRNLCLTNKIWSYYQAGLYIVASDTEAQQQFIEQKQGHGVCTSLSTAAFVQALEEVLLNRELIRNKRSDRFFKAASAAWENESVLLVNKWKEIAV